MEPRFLPLRARSEGSFRLRPAFPGTAVVLGEATYEVLSETELPEDGLVVYRLRRWPEGEVVRDRVVYGPAFVRARRGRAGAGARAARVPGRWRFLLYPLVGLLPEEEQERLSDRLGLYAVTATLVSGLAEALGMLSALLLIARPATRAAPSALLRRLPGLVAARPARPRPRVRRRVPARDRRLGACRPARFESLRALGALRRATTPASCR